jgi:hypothetical protein
VHVSRHRGCGLAPWNITQFDVHETPNGVYVDEDPLIFFHYHRVRMLASGGYLWRPPGYYISAENRRLVYDPYLEELDRAVEQVRERVPGFSGGLDAPPSRRENFQLELNHAASWFVWKTPWLMRYRNRRWRVSEEALAESA